jgi:hypothetical protein
MRTISSERFSYLELTLDLTLLYISAIRICCIPLLFGRLHGFEVWPDAGGLPTALLTGKSTGCVHRHSSVKIQRAESKAQRYDLTANIRGQRLTAGRESLLLLLQVG